MISLFDGIYPNKRLVSSNQLQIMLRLFQQDLMSSLVEISYSSDDKVLLLLNSGKIICAYYCKNDVISQYPLSDLTVLLNSHSESQIRVCELAPSFLRAVKTIIEQPNSSNTFSSTTAALPGIIKEYETIAEPSLLRIIWSHAEGFVFLPGNSFSPRQYAFLSEDQPSDSAAAVSMFSRWSEAECIVSQYIDDSHIEIWKENTLQLGFALLIEQTMRRYEELVGHLLSRKLEDSLNRLSQTQSWGISIANTSVDDVQLFESVATATIAYRMILDLASRQITAVIGPRLFNEAVDNSMDNLSNKLRQAVKDNKLVAALSADL
jgi:hypothetical protein